MPVGTDGPYGGYRLQRHDSDATKRYGGAVRPNAGSGFVRKLQNHLVAVGIHFGQEKEGEFGERTQWALREFQIYAKMATVAVEVVPDAPTQAARLAPIENDVLYAGPVSGYLNPESAGLLARWVEKAFRVPLVVEAWSLDNQGDLASVIAGFDNLWDVRDLEDAKPRVLARDVSGYYRPASALTDRTGVGRMVMVDDATDPTGRSGGPRTIPPPGKPASVWTEGEVLPQNLTGEPLGALGTPLRSTFKVIRTISEQECYGFFDSLNAYDKVVCSYGPCHWALGVGSGELWGLLAYLRHKQPGVYEKAAGFFGLEPSLSWAKEGRETGEALFNQGQRKYAAWGTLPQEGDQRRRRSAIPANLKSANYLRSWHWYYRWIMAARTIDGFQKATYVYARLRIRDVLDAPWGGGLKVDVGGGVVRPAKIGDVVTSERGVAMLLRLHVYKPGRVLSGGEATARIRGSLKDVAIPNTPRGAWGDEIEKRINAGLEAAIRGIEQTLPRGQRAGYRNFLATIDLLKQWPVWKVGNGPANPRGYTLDPTTVEPLSEAALSFTLHDAGLPPAPPPPKPRTRPASPRRPRRST